jgi:hypothetical protein
MASILQGQGIGLVGGTGTLLLPTAAEQHNTHNACARSAGHRPADLQRKLQTDKTRLPAP